MQNYKCHKYTLHSFQTVNQAYAYYWEFRYLPLPMVVIPLEELTLGPLKPLPLGLQDFLRYVMGSRLSTCAAVQHCSFLE